LVLLGANKRLTVLLGNGDGTFGEPVAYTLAQSASAHVVGDLNADRHPDVVVVPTLGDLVVFLGNADGTLAPVDAVPRPDPSIAEVLLADLDGDQRAEFIWSNPGDPVIRILSGVGTGTLGDIVEVNVGEVFGSAPVLAVADLNQDNQPDLVVGRRTGGNDAVTIVANAGGGSLVVDQAIELDGTRGIAAVEVLDLNGDGRQDIAAQSRGASSNGAFVAYGLEADGAGGYAWRRLCEGLAVQPGSILEVTGDDYADGVFCADGGIIAFEGQPDGRIESPSVIDIGHSGRVRPKRLAAGDLDGDGGTDLVSQGGGVLFNQGGGVFEEIPLL